jgi:integrase/recombinase XerD
MTTAVPSAALATIQPAIDLAIGEHTEGPVFLAADGWRLDRHGAGRIVRKTARRPGSPRPSRPTRSGTLSSQPPKGRWSTAAGRAGGRLARRSADDDAVPKRARGSLDRHATYIVAAYLAGAAR